MVGIFAFLTQHRSPPKRRLRLVVVTAACDRCVLEPKRRVERPLSSGHICMGHKGIQATYIRTQGGSRTLQGGSRTRRRSLPPRAAERVRPPRVDVRTKLGVPHLPLKRNGYAHIRTYVSRVRFGWCRHPFDVGVSDGTSTGTSSGTRPRHGHAAASDDGTRD